MSAHLIIKSASANPNKDQLSDDGEGCHSKRDHCNIIQISHSIDGQAPNLLCWHHCIVYGIVYSERNDSHGCCQVYALTTPHK